MVGQLDVGVSAVGSRLVRPAAFLGDFKLQQDSGLAATSASSDEDPVSPPADVSPRPPSSLVTFNKYSVMGKKKDMEGNVNGRLSDDGGTNGGNDGND